jgi:uncharacterized protein (TIGR03382 family)
MIGGGLLAAVPVLTFILWLASGRETLTKSVRNVEVSVRDELFGDFTLEVRPVRGAILGYYIGLDLVIGVTIAATVAAVAWWWIARRRRSAAPMEASPR